jgi:hypothetical protein
MLVDILPGGPVLDVDGAFSVLEVGLTATVRGRPKAHYQGQVVAHSGSSPAARRNRLRFTNLAPFPATLADGRPVTILPTAILEV